MVNYLGISSFRCPSTLLYQDWESCYPIFLGGDSQRLREAGFFIVFKMKINTLVLTVYFLGIFSFRLFILFFRQKQ